MEILRNFFLHFSLFFPIFPQNHSTFLGDTISQTPTRMAHFHIFPKSSIAPINAKMGEKAQLSYKNTFI